MPITPPALMELTSTVVPVWLDSVVIDVRIISMSVRTSPVRMDSARMVSMTSVVPVTRDTRERPVVTAPTQRIVISAEVAVLGRLFSTQIGKRDPGMNCSPTRTSQNSSEFINYLSTRRIG